MVVFIRGQHRIYVFHQSILIKLLNLYLISGLVVEPKHLGHERVWPFCFDICSVCSRLLFLFEVDWVASLIYYFLSRLSVTTVALLQSFVLLRCYLDGMIVVDMMSILFVWVYVHIGAIRILLILSVHIDWAKGLLVLKSQKLRSLLSFRSFLSGLAHRFLHKWLNSSLLN